MPFFSVVIPVYNKANFLAQTLRRVFNQDFEDFEVIIVNDGSTDNSLAVIHQFKDKRLHIFNQKNQGASMARNFGIEKSQSKWIALLDADDIWSKNHLQELYIGIHNLPNAKVISTAYQIELYYNFIKQPAYSQTKPKTICYIDDYFAYSLIDPLFWTSTLAFTKNSFREIGGFDPKLKTGQDIDLIIRFALTYPLGYNPKVTLSYKKQTENNLSIESHLQDKCKYIDKHKIAEKTNTSLKRYLDINRYALALQAKTQNQMNLYSSMKSDIDANNLNLKQRFLISLPKAILKCLKSLQKSMIKFGIYKSAFT